MFTWIRTKQRMLRPVSQVAHMETRLGPAGRYVDPVSQHSRRHCVSFVQDLVNLVPSGLLRMQLNTLVSFLCCQEGWVQIISQKRISERVIEVCPCARASEFERDLSICPCVASGWHVSLRDGATERRLNGGNNERLGFWMRSSRWRV